MTPCASRTAHRKMVPCARCPACVVLSSAKKKRYKLDKQDKFENISESYETFLQQTEIRYCYYRETYKVLGNTFGMLVIQVRPAELCEVLGVGPRRRQSNQEVLRTLDTGEKRKEEGPGTKWKNRTITLSPQASSSDLRPSETFHQSTKMQSCVVLAPQTSGVL